MDNALTSRGGRTIGRMLRLDPAHPPLWRSTTSLQFGAEPVAVIDDPQPWELRMIGELERGILEMALDPVAVALGAPENAAADLVRRLRRALLPTATIRVGATLQVPDAFPRARADRVAGWLAAAGVDVARTTWFGAPGEVVEAGAPVILLAHHVVEPRRAAALMGADVPHLPLVLTGTGAEIGPYVDPGRTPCLSCVAAHRRDADPAWPQVAAQLLGRAAPELSDAIVAEAAFVAARLLSESARTPGRRRCHSLTLREGELHRVMRSHRPHAECGCRSLGGIARADAPVRHATTRASVLDRPA